MWIDTLKDWAKTAWRAVTGSDQQPSQSTTPQPPAASSTPTESAYDIFRKSPEGQRITQEIGELREQLRTQQQQVVTPVKSDRRSVARFVWASGGDAAEDLLRSFAFTKSGPVVTIKKGKVHNSGRGIADVAQTNVTIAGTEAAPTWVYVRATKTGTFTATIESNATELGGNDTYWYFLLYTFYLNAGNVAVKAWDWRYDMRLASPLQ